MWRRLNEPEQPHSPTVPRQHNTEMAFALLLRRQDLGGLQLQSDLVAPQKDVQPVRGFSPNGCVQNADVKIPGQLQVGHGDGEMKDVSVAHMSLCRPNA